MAKDLLLAGRKKLSHEIQFLMISVRAKPSFLGLMIRS